MNLYQHITFVLSTVGQDSWRTGYSKIGWDFLFLRLYDYNFSGKTVASIDLENHVLYAHSFVDSMVALAKLVEKNVGKLVGKCSTDDY